MATFEEIKRRSGGGSQAVGPSFSTVPEDTRGAYEKVSDNMSDFSTGFVKRGLSTLQNIGQATLAAPALLPGGKTFGERREEIKGTTGLDSSLFETEGKWEERGAFAQDIVQFIVPGSRIVKAGKFVKGAISTGGKIRAVGGTLGRAGTEAVGFGTIGSAQQGEFDEGTTIFAGVIPIGGAMLSRIAKGAGYLAIGPKGVKGIQARYADPDGVASFLRTARNKSGGATVGDIEKLITKGIEAVRVNVRDNYQTALKNLPKRLGRNPKVSTTGQSTTIKVDGKKYVLSMPGIKSFLTTRLREFGVNVNSRAKTFDFLESPFSKAHENKLREVFRLVDNWKNTTPEGLNMLARKIGNLEVPPDSKGGRALNTVIGGMRDDIRQYLGKRIPAIKNLNASYAAGKDFLAKLDVNITGKSKLSVDQTADKLLTLAKNLDDPFKKVESEKLLLQLEQHTGISIIRFLRGLATAENLYPASGQGLRAGVVKELVRILNVGLSEIAGVAGRVKGGSTGSNIKSGIIGTGSQLNNE